VCFSQWVEHHTWTWFNSFSAINGIKKHEHGHFPAQWSTTTLVARSLWLPGLNIQWYWPPNSSDMMSHNFFVWGLAKNVVYSEWSTGIKVLTTNHHGLPANHTRDAEQDEMNCVMPAEGDMLSHHRLLSL